MQQSATNLELAANSSSPGPVSPTKKVTLVTAEANLAKTLSNKAALSPPRGTCYQVIWFSFFFDGTGNNLTYDVENGKHSNVAKLYRAHEGKSNVGGVKDPKDPKNPTNSIHRVYIPGLGTYFPKVGDAGGSEIGLGTGFYGIERLRFALDEFDLYMAAHLALAADPKNKITEINVAAFGFSRGAAAARAFMNLFIEEKCVRRRGKLFTAEGGAPVRLRFLGIFDTVASVGAPMSTNNMVGTDALRGTTRSHIDIRLKKYPTLAPRMLAFSHRGEAGADPAPGPCNGHLDWGDRLKIPHDVEHVVHFIAGHETRNSFPVDSICVAGSNGVWTKPSHWMEFVYAGVHSDVGGSYSPGEGGKNELAETKFGLLTLAQMYDLAIFKGGVPFLPRKAWMEDQRRDFAMSREVIEDYQYYINAMNPAQTLGESIIEHMRLYYAWRFHKIYNKYIGREKDDNESRKIDELDKRLFKRKRDNFAQSEKELEQAYNHARSNVVQAARPTRLFELQSEIRRRVVAAQAEERQAYEKYRNVAARNFSVPKTEALEDMIDFYDKQLLTDVQSIYDAVRHPENAGRRGFTTAWGTMRPFYIAMVQAYENEFVRRKGLSDDRIIAFFDKYVHNSIAGFGADATLPSDPRVVYVGEDFKVKYALNNFPQDVAMA
ncbi:DUF2235 domain-containing protein [Massilia sp. PAMC28688]|uniref:phospholipase effector Tle1 domain-containing protein n=1 Tax=Massilia sp. PAMC28688 TaxID=2861283 RepID=UPI001C630351|nr:DUF2235 domain-containing protein [Massilia sp. PAMC28688]QYF92056.1 DUF2235 domain-containing protein [Massilia sp. PAMC28688]